MKRIFVTLLMLAMGVYVAAQVQLSATTDKTNLTLDDELTLTVQVSGVSGTMVMPQLPSLPAFNVYSREAAQSTINGKSTLQFKYTMMPRFVGNTSIGPVTFKYGGKTYQTKPIAVHIYRSTNALPKETSAPQATAAAAQAVSQLPPLERELATRAYAHVNEPYFIVAAVSNKTPYVNEPFTLAVRFYYSQAFYDAPYQNPAVSNLFMEETSQAQGQQNIQGRLYRYEEKRYQLSGVSAGKASIGAATVSFRPGDSPLSILDRFFGGAAVQAEQTVSSKPMELIIKALPTAGRPSSFYGAVGTGYTFSTKLDRLQTEAADAVTWSATVQGPNNLKTTSDLSFPNLPGITAYAAAPTTGVLPSNKTRSYKVFKTELVPAVSGTYTLPALSWSYFDPQAGLYKTLVSQPITLTVTPSTRAEKQVDFSGTDTPNGVQTLGHDIRYVISNPEPQSSWLVLLPHWKWVHALVFTWLAICLFMASIGKKTVTKKHAYLTAKAQLKKAKIYEDVSDSLSAYLLTKWHISTASLPLKEIVHALDNRHVTLSTQQQFANLWKELESARFAPQLDQAATIAQFVTRSTELLKKLEETK